MPDKSPYDVDGKPTIRPSYCVYMDILGFTELTQMAFAEGKGQDLLSKLHRAMTEGPGALSEETHFKSDTPAPWIHKVFTDNVVLGHIIYTRDGEGEFGDVISDVAYYQMSMALEGFFVRGGFTIGPLYLSNEMVYGTALIEAYHLESDFSIHPRIVISDGLMGVVNKHLKFYAEPEESPQNQEILVDHDNRPFVNYLATLVSDERYLYEPDIRKHKQILESQLSSTRNSPRVWAKYAWVANYHNYFFALFKDWDGYSDDLLIDIQFNLPQPHRLVG